MPGGDGEDVGVDDDVVGREADLVDEQVVGPPGDLDLALDGVGLADLVEGHHDHGGAVVEADASLFEELVDTFLHRDRVDDRLALHALQAGFDHAELRRVDHHRHAGDLGFAGDQVEERGHRLDAVDQAVVHVDVDDLGAVLHLVASDVERRGVVVLLDQPAELGRAGDVRALADVDERDVVGQVERLEAGQFEPRRTGRHDTWREPDDRLGDRGDVRRRGAAAAADDVDETGLGELLDEPAGRLGAFVVVAEFIGQPGVGVHAEQRVGDGGDLLDVGPHLLGTERAVQADRQRLGVADRLPERGRCLAGQRATRTVGDRARDHQRQLRAGAGERTAGGDDGRLGVQRVEDRLDEQQVDAALDQRVDLLLVGGGEAGEGDRPVAGIFDPR